MPTSISKTVILAHLDEELYRHLPLEARQKMKWSGVIRGTDGPRSFECESHAPYGGANKGFTIKNMIVEYVTDTLQDDGRWHRTVEYVVHPEASFSGENYHATFFRIPKPMNVEHTEETERDERAVAEHSRKEDQN